MGRVLAILAEQRSGTTAVAETLGSMPGVRNLGEVFHTAPLVYDADTAATSFIYHDGNYHLFRLRQEDLDRSRAADHVLSQQELFQNYLKHVTNHEGTWTVISIKYNSCNYLNGAWHSIGHEPELIKYLKESGAVILHIERRNKLARWISEYSANESGVFHYHKTPDHLVRRGIELDIKETIRKITESIFLANLHRSYLSNYDQVISAYYENIMREDRLTGCFVDALHDFGIPISDDATKVVLKSSRNCYRLIINNWAELSNAIAVTEHSWMLNDLGPAPETLSTSELEQSVDEELMRQSETRHWFSKIFGNL